jgi:hypothetical protein
MGKGWADVLMVGIGIERSLQKAGKLEWMNDWWMTIIEPGHFLSYYASKWTGAGKVESPTYSNATPQLTAQVGKPVPFAQGLCYLSGNIVRQNDFEEDTDYIKLLVDFGEGEWDAILATYINDVEWTNLVDTGHQKTFYMGTASQSFISSLFPDDPCAFRNHVIGEFRLKKGDEVNSISNITVIARTRKCLEIGQNIGGTETFTRDPLQVLWDFYLKKKKADYTTEMLPWVNDWLSASAYGKASLCDTDKTYYPVNVPAPAGNLIKETSTYKKRYARYAFDLDTPVIGDSGLKSAWTANDNTNQRVNLDFGRKVVLTRLQLSNYHDAGGYTNEGIKNFVIQGSNSVTAFNNTLYTAAGWTDVQTGLQAAQHPASDTPNWQTFNLTTNVTGYRYYSIKIADNWGGGSRMGIRQVRCFTGNAPSACTGDEVNIRYAFDFNNDSIVSINDYEKTVWQSFNGMVIRSQGAYKPVWDGAQEADGAGALQNKAIRYTFTVGDNTVEKSLTWHKIDKKNVYRVECRDSSDKFKKCPDAEIKNDEDVALRGEDTDADDFPWCIDTCIAARRVKRKFNKNQYADYITGLTGFPSSQALELFDRVALTAANAGWAGKDYIVVDKVEDAYGRCGYVLEAYLSGVHEDKGFELQQGYGVRVINNMEPLSPVDIDKIILENTILSHKADKKANSTIKLTWQLNSSGSYSHTNIYTSTDDSIYVLAAQDDTGNTEIDGAGKLWDLGETVYVKLQNVNKNGDKSVLSDTYDASIVTESLAKMASFFTGEYDLWAGNADIDHGDTKIVLGGLNVTPKLALGAYADRLTIDNYATYAGFYADGDGKFRAGGSGQYFKWSGTALSWQGTNTSLTEAGLFTASNAVITGQITASTGAIANFTIAENSLTTTLLGLHAAGYAEGAEILLGHATAYASAKIGLKADGSGKLASGNWSWDTTGNITSTGNIELTAGYLRASGTTGNYTSIAAAGITAVSASLGTTVNIPSSGAAPTFSSGTLKEMVYEIYTSGVIRTNADPAANGGMIINNVEMKGYNSAGTLLYKSVWDGTDEGDFYAGNYAGGASGISYDHSAGTMAIDADLRIRAGHDIYLYGDDSNPGTITFLGSSYQVQFGMNATGKSFLITPSNADYNGLNIGSLTYPFSTIGMMAKSTVAMSAINVDSSYQASVSAVADAHSYITSKIGSPTDLGFGGYLNLYYSTQYKALYPTSDYREIPTLGTSDHGWQGLHLAGNGGITQAFINATTTDLNLQIGGTTYATLTNSLFSTKGDITLNSDLGDATSTLTFGRTTGGNATIIWNGTNIVIDKALGETSFNYPSDTPGVGFNLGGWAALRNPLTGIGVFSLDFYNGSTWDSGLMVASGGQIAIGVTSFIGTEKLRVNGDIYGDGNISGLSFTDRTPFYEGDALAEIMKIKGHNGEIDHSTLPAFTYRQMVKKLVDGVEEVEEGRDIGATVSMLIVAVQQLRKRLGAES